MVFIAKYATLAPPASIGYLYNLSRFSLIIKGMASFITCCATMTMTFDALQSFALVDSVTIHY